jgi:hypothetical protein
MASRSISSVSPIAASGFRVLDFNATNAYYVYV